MAHKCECGQETKTVVLVGCTQQGKSSLVRAILDYSGDKEEADAVGVGTFGNRSTTKDCRIFYPTVEAKSHYLRSEDGSQVEVDLVHSDFDDLVDLPMEAYESGTGEHIHLRLIDTPGLDDSDNNSESQNQAFDEQSSHDLMRTVDEKHKLAIIKTLVEVGTIHAVCFVISVYSPLGDSMISLIQACIGLFQHAGLDSSFHFAHTKASPSMVLGGVATSRPSDVDGKFQLPGASHHFINTEPVLADPLERFFTYRELSKLLKTFAQGPAMTTQELKYPKTQVHRGMEDVFNDIIESTNRQERATIDQRTAKLAKLNAKVGPLRAREKNQKESWSSLYNQYKNLNTEELVVIARHTGSERSHTFQRSRIFISMTTDVPIRMIEKSSSPANCKWKGQSDSDFMNRKYFAQTLTGPDWGYQIDGTVKLYGWKKEHLKNLLDSVKSQEEEAWSNYSETSDNREEIDDEINGIDKANSDARATMDTLSEAQRGFDTDFLSLEVIKARPNYLATNSIISYAYGIDFSRSRIDSSHFATQPTESSVNSAKTHFKDKEAALSRMEASCKAMLSDVKKGQEAVKKKVAELETKSKRVDDAIAGDYELLEKLPKWKPSKLASVDGGVGNDLAEVREELMTVLVQGREVVQDAVEAHASQLQQRHGIAMQGIQRLTELGRRLEGVSKVYQRKRADIEASLAATRAMLEHVFDRTSLGSGLAAALKQGLNNFGGDTDKPYKFVYWHLKQAYRDDPDNWPEILETL